MNKVRLFSVSLSNHKFLPFVHPSRTCNAMKSLPIGSIRTYTKTVSPEDVARFETGMVHEVYSTFALARDAEWSGRLFVLEMKEDGEEGIGTALSVNHRSPAFPGEEVIFTSVLSEINGNEVVTNFTVEAGGREIAHGTQKQRVLAEEKIQKAFAAARNFSGQNEENGPRKNTAS